MAMVMRALLISLLLTAIATRRLPGDSRKGKGKARTELQPRTPEVRSQVALNLDLDGDFPALGNPKGQGKSQHRQGRFRTPELKEADELVSVWTSKEADAPVSELAAAPVDVLPQPETEAKKSEAEESAEVSKGARDVESRREKDGEEFPAPFVGVPTPSTRFVFPESLEEVQNDARKRKLATGASTETSTFVLRKTTAEASDIVELNVGGKFFTTTRATLRRYPSSRLASFFDADSEHALPAATPSGAVFIDNDGSCFHVVLDFLRSGRLIVENGELPFLLKRLRRDADFYGLPELASEVDRHKVRIHKLHTIPAQDPVSFRMSKPASMEEQLETFLQNRTNYRIVSCGPAGYSSHDACYIETWEAA